MSYKSGRRLFYGDTTTVTTTNSGLSVKKQDYYSGGRIMSSPSKSNIGFGESNIDHALLTIYFSLIPGYTAFRTLEKATNVELSGLYEKMYTI